MGKWMERRRLGRMLIKKEEQKLKETRKREWMKMFVRMLLQLRLRIGLKVKRVRRLSGHQGLTLWMLRKVRV